MERAGAGWRALVGEVAPSGPVAVVCGKGNNGGDGSSAARLLREAGREVARARRRADPTELSGDAARATSSGCPASRRGRSRRRRSTGARCVVDALLGTGFAGEPREPVGERDRGDRTPPDAPVVAADVPSGVDASTGEVEGEAVRAAATATFHAAKPGLWIDPGKAHAGEVRVVDIGIPPGAPVEAARRRR